MKSFLRELVSTQTYKTQQGRRARTWTFIGILVFFLLGAYSWYSRSATHATLGPFIVVLLGAWLGFRAVNFPPFADFLVSVDAEMSKVSWPTRHELFASTKVVLIFMFLFTALLFIYDMIFSFIPY